MERYLHSIASQEEALRSMYEPTAFLLDQDRASTLPNMAAGLSSVAFAINFDAMYLDSPRRFVDVFSGTVFLSPPATSDPTPAGGDDDEDEVVAVRVPKEKKKETHRRKGLVPGLPYPVGPPADQVAVPTLVPVTEGGGITEPPSSPNISRQLERKLSAEVASREQLSAELEALKAQQQMSHTSMQSLER
eukprot:Em0020g211a